MTETNTDTGTKSIEVELWPESMTESEDHKRLGRMILFLLRRLRDSLARASGDELAARGAVDKLARELWEGTIDG